MSRSETLFANAQKHIPGGVTLDTAPALIARGASMVAVIHALFAADGPAEVERRARAFNALFAS